jgi:hypothetical protein
MTTTTPETVRYVDGRGSVEVLRVSERCSIFVARGQLTERLAHAIGDEGRRIVSSGRAVALHDWSGLTGYEPVARQICTSFMVEHRRDFEAVTILATSALVAMGVNVANLGLGGFLHATTDRDEFEALVQRFRTPVPNAG